MFGAISVPTYGARKSLVGARTGDGTYTNVVQLGAIQLFNVTMNVKTDELPGDDHIVDVVTFPLKAKGKLRMGVWDFTTMVNMLGQTKETSGSGATLRNRMRFVGKNLPYFGFVGESLGSDGIGARTGFAPMCKITSDHQIFGGEYQKYPTVDLDIDMLFDPFWPTHGTTEVQLITITGTPTGGTFTITMDGATTSALAYNASAATVQSALQALSTIGSGNVLVTGSAGGPYTLTFAGDLAETDVNTVSVDITLLTGGTPVVAVTVPTPGVNAEDVVLDVCDWARKPTTLTLPPLAI